MRKKILAAVLMLVLVALAGCASGGGSPEEVKRDLQPVTVMLDWVPNTNHTGLYVALEKGWYKDEGLQVEIVEPTQGGTTQLVATGQAQFGVGYQEDVTQARAGDVPVVSIAAVIQHNTSGFASKKEAGITRPRDMEGKRYGGWGSPTEEAVLKAVVENDGGDFNKVEILNIGTSDFFTAIERDVDFAWIYYGWTGIEAEQRGLDLNYIELRELDRALDYYTPVLITGEKLIKENPELVQKFMRATTRGYEFAIAHPDEAARILLKHAPELNEELVLASQRYLSPRYRDDADRWGEQKAEVWERYARWMYDHKLLPGMIEADKAFTNQFLPN
ncbi:ABC transporter substrate-binding protein [Desulfoscipio geothermicus]|uniref:ABC-type nitrate/sulfonate/bicarbonate transport system, substrate-binding protein n=1 Tax=Desulfoscipio geothermicus DSM 3669 TaxID=1121426 RepID=A0A1I6CPX4_9FIRM|nr:ABC transporter substrate-binding protein [Desulfoscipio geothermicus]SFQ95208.1 ABC-type nitrate/sulfonate/bicarbonate transport system, substrate-binding protein [Desulfoscipio geothermicus DSM 3669]